MNTLLKVPSLLLVFILPWLSCFGQQNYYVKLSSRESLPDAFLRLENEALDSLSVINELNSLIKLAQNDGFLLANLDELLFSTDTVYAHIYVGDKYDEIRLLDAGLTKTEIKSTGLRWKNSTAKIQHQNLSGVFSRMLKEKQNNGFPFASISFDSIVVEDTQLSSKLLINQGGLIVFDSLLIANKEVLNYQFISGYLDMKHGDAFDQSKVDLISQKINQLPYLKLISKPIVNFRLGKAQVSFDIEDQKANFFDGIVGFVPNENGDGNKLTGEVNLSFDNLFKTGKKIDFEWQKLDSKSQFLDFNFKNPRILNSPLNFSFSFNQIKEDTLFSNRSYSLGFYYSVSPTINLFVDFENKKGNNFNSIDSNVGDFDLNNYKLGMNWQKLDDIRFPKNGYRINIATIIGSKKTTLIQNSSISHNVSSQYQFIGDVAYYKRLGKRSVFHVKLGGAYVQNEQLFLNDLFRIGGLNSIRGFNEKAFFASQYSLLNVEWRWLMASGSYFLIFTDQASMKYELESSSFNDSPVGVGLGFKIKTKSGFFNLIYGLGKTKEQNFSFNFSKLHFGYAAIL